MFTAFLTALAVVVSIVLLVLLAWPHRDAVPLHIPYSGLTVLIAAVGLAALGFWLV